MTFEELKEEYPIGTKLGERYYIYVDTAYYYNDDDLALYLSYPNVLKVSKTTQDNICELTIRRKTYDYQVDGYLYDGDWHLVQDTWDGYIPIKIENKNLTSNQNSSIINI